MNEKTIITILMVAVVGLLGATAYFATINQTCQPPTVSTSKVTQQPPQQNNISATVPNDLIEYKNSEFEINYPSSWIIDKSYESQGVIWLRTKSRQADIDAKKLTRIFDIEIRAYKNAAELPNNEQSKFSLADWIDKKADEWGFVSRTPIVIDGVSGYKGIGDGEAYGNYLQFVEKKGKIYQIEIEGKATEEEINVVKSFKFAQ